jgi:hypothetical protein
MVLAMSGLLRWARPCVVGLLTLALVVGINGFVGAIHSVHHLSAPVTASAHDAESHGHDGGDATPAGGPQAPCPLAAAALHLAATAVEALPGLELAQAGARLVALGPQDEPRAAWTEPARGRAPPFPGTIPS